MTREAEVLSFKIGERVGIRVSPEYNGAWAADHTRGTVVGHKDYKLGGEGSSWYVEVQPDPNPLGCRCSGGGYKVAEHLQGGYSPGNLFRQSPPEGVTFDD